MDNLQGIFGQSNFGQSMELSEYMEGYPEGFSITDQDLPFHDETGEIIGYMTEQPKETDYFSELARDELDSVFLEQVNGVEPPQEIELPIAFGIFKWGLENGYSFEESFEMASEVYEQNWRDYDIEVSIVSEGIRHLHNAQTCDSDQGNFLWAVSRLLGQLPRQPEPVILKREPVIDDQATQTDESTTLCRLFDSIDWAYRMDNIRACRFPEYCFRDNGSKVLADEEMRYRSRMKTERQERKENILAWIQKASKKRLVEAFGQNGVFWARLKKSRTECLGKSGKGLKTPMELYLTKAQVDEIWAMAKEKLGWKGK